MAILSPIMSYVVDNELGFPIPSQKEKINKALKRYRYILSQHPKRADAPEIMFGIADLLVGRGNPGDYNDALRFYDHILLHLPPEYLKARALIGKAELLIGNPDEFDNAISLCEKARQILGKDLADFFAAKTIAVEVELRLARQAEGDWKKALGLINLLIKAKKTHWYFLGRALLSKAEIIFWRNPKNLGEPLKLVNAALIKLKTREDDYFTNKGKVLRAEMLTRRAKKGDFERAEKLLVDVLKMSMDYKDLIARAKLDLADVVRHPKATRLIKEVLQMEGLDPYLIDKASIIEKALKHSKKKKKKEKKIKKLRRR